MEWMLFGAWYIWILGPGDISQEALAVDSGGTVHLVYKSGDAMLVHAWFTGNTWESETLGICTWTPVLRVGAVDKGLHILAGQNLTYYYNSGSGWRKKALIYSARDYDLAVYDRPTILLSNSGKVFRGTGDTFGNFNFHVIDSSWHSVVPLDPPYCYYRGSKVGGPAAIYGDSNLYFWCWYSYVAPCKGGSGEPDSRAVDEMVPTCMCAYWRLKRGGCSDCRDECCWSGVCEIKEITSEYTYLVYNPALSGGTIAIYPTGEERVGFRGADIQLLEDEYLISAIYCNDSLVYLLYGADDPKPEPIDTTKAKGVTSIAAPEEESIFIAFVGLDGIVRVGCNKIFWGKTSPPEPPGFIAGNLIFRGRVSSEDYIKFVAGAAGLLTLNLYRSDGTLAVQVRKDVNRGQVVLVPVGGLGPGVYYLRFEIAGYSGLFKVILI